MTITKLTTELAKMYAKHGDIDVMLESLPIETVEHVRAIDGEHLSYVDLVTKDDR